MENKDIYELPFNKYYYNKGKEIIPVKTAFAKSFSLIERKMRLKCHISLDECKNLNIKNYEVIKIQFKNISLLTFEEAKIYLNTVNRLRNNNTHLFRNEPNKVKNYKFFFDKLNKDVQSPYKYENNGKLTFYGMITILCFMLDKSYINDFFETLLSTNREFRHYKDVKNGDNRPLVAHTKTMFALTYNNKTIDEDHIQNSDLVINPNAYQALNTLVRNSISKLIYEFEYYLASKYDYRKHKNPLGFRILINNEQRFKNYPDQINDLIYLRNIFFHGYWLYDEIYFCKEKVPLTIKILLDICDEWKYILLTFEDSKLNPLIDIIDKFAYHIIHSKYGRILELSYKILNKNLFDETKVNNRVENINAIYDSIINKHDISDEEISRAHEVIGKQINFKLERAKFLDGLNRNNLLESITLLSIESDSKIKINETITDFNKLNIVDISGFDTNLVKINNKEIKDLESYESYAVNNFINIKKIKIL